MARSKRTIVRRTADVVSRYMAAIRSKDTVPEKMLRQALRELRIPFRTNDGRLPGTPDVSFPSARVAVFVDGCFWHACPKCYVRPSVNSQYWRNKAARNVRRDRRTGRRLRALGWSVLRIRECALERDVTSCVARIGRALARRAVEVI